MIVCKREGKCQRSRRLATAAGLAVKDSYKKS